MGWRGFLERFFSSFDFKKSRKRTERAPYGAVAPLVTRRRVDGHREKVGVSVGVFRSGMILDTAAV